MASYAHGRLAEYRDEPIKDHQWCSVLAVMRGAALQPSDAFYWYRLADAASDLNLWALAELAARECARLDPSRDNVAQHVRTLINLGEMEEALKVLGEPTSPYECNLKAHLLLHQGRAEAAAALFAECPAEPESATGQS